MKRRGFIQLLGGIVGAVVTWLIVPYDVAPTMSLEPRFPTPTAKEYFASGMYLINMPPCLDNKPAKPNRLGRFNGPGYSCIATWDEARGAWNIYRYSSFGEARWDGSQWVDERK